MTKTSKTHINESVGGLLKTRKRSGIRNRRRRKKVKSVNHCVRSLNPEQVRQTSLDKKSMHKFIDCAKHAFGSTVLLGCVMTELQC